MKFRTLVIFILVVLYENRADSPSEDCPSACICKEERRYKFVIVDCKSLELSSIPSVMPNQTTEVDLSSNHIGSVAELHFSKWPKHSVEKIDLAKNKIRTIDEKAFSLFINLKKLYLDFNMITSVSNLLFPQSLSKLMLASNPLQNLDVREFIQKAPKLTVLDLSNCGISSLPDDLQYLQSLKNMYLSCANEEQINLDVRIICTTDTLFTIVSSNSTTTSFTTKSSNLITTSSPSISKKTSKESFLSSTPYKQSNIYSTEKSISDTQNRSRNLNPVCGSNESENSCTSSIIIALFIGLIIGSSIVAAVWFIYRKRNGVNNLENRHESNESTSLRELEDK